MIEILDERLELNFRQRWASYLTIAAAIAGLLGGLLLRNSITNATIRFENKQTGITVRYPADWLLEQGQENSDLVIRVQDPAATPFKTTLQISLQPIGEGARVAYILDLLNIDRAATLAAYRPLEIVPISLPSGVQGTQMTYAYVASEANPFLQSVPIVVRAIDVVVIRGSQAIIVTYEADAPSFERNRHYFDTFLRTLEL